MAVILSAASLVIAAAAFYLTVLRSADINVTYVPLGDEFVVGTFTGLLPHWVGESYIRLGFYIHNIGASGGVLVGMKHVAVTGAEEVLFEPPRNPTFSATPDPDRTARFPIGLTAGEVQTLYLVARLTLTHTASQRMPADPDADARDLEALASALATVSDLAVSVTWTYVSRASLIGTLVRREPRVRTRSSATTAQVSVDGLREVFIRHWRNSADHAMLGEQARHAIELATAGRGL